MSAFFRFCGEVLATVLVLGVLTVAGALVVGGTLYYGATGWLHRRRARRDAWRTHVQLTGEALAKAWRKTQDRRLA